VAIWHREIRIDDETVDILNFLKRMDKKIALVSNFDHPPYLRNLLKEHQIDAYFDSIVISGDVGIKKPDSRIFDNAFNDTLLKPEEVVYVGDTDEDVAAARAARILPIVIQRNGTKNILLDYVHGQNTKKMQKLKQGDDLLKIQRLNQLKELF
jgi:putative hydrolase of the HAD superfamily